MLNINLYFKFFKIMELIDIIEEIVDDDLLFILKYGLLISNFITIFILLYIKSRK